MSYTIGLNICAIIARIKKHKSIIIKKKIKKDDEIASLANPNSDCIKGSVIRSLTHYFLLTDVLREYDHIKQKINKLETSQVS